MLRPTRTVIDAMTVSGAESIGRARDRVLGRITDACARVGRDPAGVRLVAVSKTVPVEQLRAAVAAGLTTLGENRVQEAEAKIAALPGVEWHLVGHLQANKAGRAVRAFSVIETVNTLDLGRRLDRLVVESGAARLPVYLEVNVDADPAKAGFTPAALEREVDLVVALPHLEVRGLMTVGRLVGSAEQARPTFAELASLSERLRARAPYLGPGLSMGMTDDFEVAVEEGATLLRIGRGLFGERPVV